jgi:hypothetical protein
MNVPGVKRRYTEAQMRWAVSMIRTGQAIVLPLDITLREYLRTSLYFLGLAAVNSACNLLARRRGVKNDPVHG